MTHPDIKVLFEPRVIAARVQALGQRLQRELAREDPLVLSLLGGSVVFLADLIRAISSPLRYELMHVEYEPGQGEELDIHYPIPVDVKGESVLVVKDVVSSAVIENYLASQLQQAGAGRVRFAVLVDLPKERKAHFQADYSVFTTERSGRLVGYGMKHDGRWGHLPYVGFLADEGGESRGLEPG
jgi:hypoxanthine phosphoribosyltransferase